MINNDFSRLLNVLRTKKKNQNMRIVLSKCINHSKLYEFHKKKNRIKYKK